MVPYMTLSALAAMRNRLAGLGLFTSAEIEQLLSDAVVPTSPASGAGARVILRYLESIPPDHDHTLIYTPDGDALAFAVECWRNAS